MSEPSARFTPMGRASRGKRLVVVLLGPLLWLVALSVVAVVTAMADVIGVGLAIAVVSFCVALVWQILWRRHRVRTEAE